MNSEPPYSQAISAGKFFGVFEEYGVSFGTLKKDTVRTQKKGVFGSICWEPGCISSTTVQIQYNLVLKYFYTRPTAFYR